MGSHAKASRRGNNEGSIYQEKSSGRWVAALVVGYDEHGHMVRKRAYAKSKSAAGGKLKDLTVRYGSSAATPAKGREQTLRQHAEGWLEDQKPYLRPGTWTRYETLLRVHILPGLGHHRLGILEPSHIRTFLREKHRTGGITARTCNHCLVLLRTVLNGAVADRKLTVNMALAPMVKPLPLTDSRPTKTLTKEQLGVFFELAANHRDGNRWIFALGMGCRVGEISGLLWSAIDFERGTVRIERELIRNKVDGVWRYQFMPPKTKKGVRVQLMPSWVVDALRRQEVQLAAERMASKTWSVEFGNLVFPAEGGRPRNGPASTHAFQQAQKNAGLIGYTQHELRHSMNTLAAGEGVDTAVTAVVMGHSRPSITSDVYTHSTLGTARLVADAMDRAVKG